MSSHSDKPISRVHVDGLVRSLLPSDTTLWVALKLIRHVREALPEIVSGQLLGLVVDGTLEVTHCFPLAAINPDDDIPEEEQARKNTESAVQMMKWLRDDNVDSNSVGWYSTVILASHLTPECIQSQYEFQKETPLSVMLLFDPVATSRGSLCLRAMRLSSPFMQLYAKGEPMTRESIAATGVAYDEIYEELPVEIVNTGLLRALIWEIEESSSMQPSFSAFDLSSNLLMEKNMSMLLESITNLQMEQGRALAYQKMVHRQAAQQQALLQKRKAENTQRKFAGQQPLPETLAALEAENPGAFKMPTEPSRIDALLATAQSHYFCDEITHFGGQDLTKLFLAKSAKNAVQ